MIYLDNAATTFPKPVSVGAALLETLAVPHGNPGRGAHDAALRSADCIWETREALSALFGAVGGERVVLTKNATEALNLTLLGLLRNTEKKNRVITSTLEHNSVLRPLYRLREEGKISLSFFEPCEDEAESGERFSHLAKDGVDLVVLTAAANTTGRLLPLSRLFRVSKEQGAITVADASQAAGHVELQLKELSADYLAVSAHKGLYGITGLGALILGEEAKTPHPLLYGGTGFDSPNTAMPIDLPEALEAGTAPFHAAAALLSGIRFVRARTVGGIAKKCAALSARFRSGLLEADCTVYGEGGDCGIVLFNHPTLSPSEVAYRLGTGGVCARAGLHCAPLAHRALGTDRLGGAVRASFGTFNTEAEVDETLSLLRRM